MFRFAVCLPGLENWLKADMARMRPDWHPAFVRPGLVTFKVPDGAEERVPSVFARRSGVSVGLFDSVDGAKAALSDCAILHVFPRDPEEGPGEGPVAVPGQKVGDVVTAGIEATLAGWHTQREGESPHPGAAWPVEVPPEAPSRAYAKIEQAIAWARLPVRAGDVAVEFGAAPGGASYALLRRGVSVIGVDPEPMDPIVLQGVMGATFTHLKTPMSQVRWEDLPRKVDWLLCDANLAPQVVLHELSRLVAPLRRRLQAAVVTLKLNDDRVVAAIPKLLHRFEDLGFTSIRAAHLPANRREITVVARP